MSRKKRLLPSERTNASHKVGNEEVAIWYDFYTRSITINVTSRYEGQKGKSAITSTGIEEIGETEIVPPFLEFNQELLEDFPGLLPALYKALQEFFGDSMDRVPGTEKHLADMRKIVEKKLGVTF